jgi:hypothetical protein
MIERIEWVDPKTRRKYQVIRDDAGNDIVIGPPEGLVDSLHLPEPFATTLHNILYDRGMFNAAEVGKNPRVLIGALQEAMNLDVQKLTEAFFNYEKEPTQG